MKKPRRATGQGDIEGTAKESYHAMRSFASRVELLDGSGAHVRHIPGQLAAAMIESGAARVANANQVTHVTVHEPHPLSA
jgi:hypothetical protein